MSALIEFFDREKTTIAILREYHDQQWKLDNDPQRIRIISDELTTPKAMSATPVHGGGSRREEKMVELIDKKAVLEKGYHRAREYMAEFDPCWERLTDEERNMLQLRFVEYLDGGGIKRIMEKYNLSRANAYRKSDAALRRLSKLLFW